MMTSDMLQANIVCASTIGGGVQIQQSAANAPWFIEAVSTSTGICASASNTIRGDIQFQNNSAPGLFNGNTIGGNLQFQNNTVLGRIVDGNTIGGNVQFDNNTGGDVSRNTVLGGNLECSNNSQLTNTKGSNTAKQKNGQCAEF